MRAQVQQLLRFARAKRVQHVKECLRLVQDLAARRVQRADVYGGAEVLEMLDELRAGLEKQVDEVRAPRGVAAPAADLPTLRESMRSVQGRRHFSAACYVLEYLCPVNEAAAPVACLGATRGCSV
jgi:hypothetical protein